MLAISCLATPSAGYEAGDLGSVVRGARALLEGRTPYDDPAAPRGNMSAVDVLPWQIVMAVASMVTGC
jgi:hypothetical protein